MSTFLRLKRCSLLLSEPENTPSAVFLNSDKGAGETSRKLSLSPKTFNRRTCPQAKSLQETKPWRCPDPPALSWVSFLADCQMARQKAILFTKSARLYTRLSTSSLTCPIKYPKKYPRG